MRNLSIRGKLSLGLLPGLFIIFSLGLLSHVALTAVVSDTQEVERIFHRHDAVGDLQLAIQRAIMPPNDYLITGDPVERTHFATLANRVEEHFAVVEEAIGDAEDAGAMLAETRGKWRQIRGLAEAILALENPVGNPRGAYLMEQMDALADEITGDFAALHQEDVLYVVAMERAAHTTQNQARALILFAVVVGLAGGLAFAWYFSARLSRPLMALTRTAEALGRGNLEARAAVRGDDEVARLGQAFNIMASALQRRLTEQSAIAEISQVFRQVTDREALFADITARIAAFMDAEQCAIALRDEVTGAFALQWPAYGMTREQVTQARFLASEAAAFLARIPTDSALVLDDPQSEEGKVGHYARLFGERSLMVAPLRIGDRVLGGIRVANKLSGDGFSEDDARLLNLIASQAALAIEKLRLYEQTRRHLEKERAARQQAETLQEVAALLIGRLEVEDVLEGLFDLLARVVDYDSVSVHLLDENGALHLAAARGLPDLEQARRDIRKLGGHMLEVKFPEKRPLVIPDTRADDRWLPLPGTEYIRSWVGAPLMIEGRLIGVLNVDSRTPYAYDEEVVERVMAFANQAAVAIERARLFAATRRHAQEQQAISEILHSLNAAFRIEEAFPAVVAGLRRITGCEGIAVGLFDEQARTTTVVAVDDPRGGSCPGSVLPLPSSAATADVLAGRAHLTPDLAAEQDSPVRQELYRAGYRSLVNLPLKAGARVIGVLSLAWRMPRGYETAHLPLLGQVAEAIALAVERNRLLTAERVARQHLEVLNSFIATAVTTSSLPDLLQTALGCALEALNLKTGAIWLPDRLVARGITRDRVSTCLRAAARSDIPFDGPILVGDWPQVRDTSLAALEPCLAPLGIRACLAVPIRVKERVIGGLGLAAAEPREWSAEEIALVEAIGQQLGAAVERLRLLEKVQGQARQVQRIVDTVPEGVVLLDPKHRVVLANPVAKDYLATLADVQVGDVLAYVGPRSLDDILTPPGNGSYHEIAIVGPPRRTFEVVAQPVGHATEPEGWVLLLRDVTREREVQQRVEQQQRLAAVGQLAAGIAHDFNNILQGMIGFADLLARRPDMPEAYRERLEMIAQAGRRGARLVRQILDFSRQTIIERHPMDLVSFLKETVALLQRTLPENIRVGLTVEPGTYWVHADPTQLHQVLTNLATNARDAMPEGGHLQVHLSHLTLNPGDPPPLPEMCPGDWIVLTVSDTGEGIPKEILPRIFEPFFTTKDVDKGTGLGLAQVYGIIQQHNGHIDVTSCPGQGTTFTMYLPAHTEEPDRVSTPHAPLTIPKGQGETILVAEDDPQVRASIQAMLEDLGYRVLTASGGEEALRLYDAHAAEVAAVLTDVIMPGLSGIALCESLRERGVTVPVVLMSGYPLGTSFEEAWCSGITAHLQKPVSHEELAQVLQALLAEDAE